MIEACHFLIRAALASIHRVTGRVWYRLGGVQRARHHFERVLDLRGGDFQAYLFLGRIAYREGDYLGWHREMEHARLTSPERFARLPRAQALFAPRAAGTILSEASGRAIWCGPDGLQTHNPQGDGLDPAAGKGTQPAPNQAPANPFPLTTAPASPDADDFASRDEREHFADLPPIAAEEVAGVDLDELARRLGDG